MPKFLSLNLQFFNENTEIENTEFESAGIIESAPASENIVRGGYNPDVEIETATMPNPLSDVEEQVEEVNEIQFEDVQTYEQQEQPYQQQFQETQQPQIDPYMQQLMFQNQQMQAQILQMQQMMSQQQVQQAPVEPELSIEEQNEQLMEQFYENPTQFVKEIEERAYQKAFEQVNPIIKERQIQSEIDALNQKYGQDFQQHIQPMRQLVNELGDQEVERIGLERVYLMAKGMSVNTQPQLNPEQIFSDETFVNEYIAKNPAVQQAVINDYLANKKNNQPPRVMSNDSGASLSLTPEQRPKSIAESSRLLRKSWGY